MDINCAICGEPWDLWGANHGDMAAWEYDLFRKGAGCPCCEGEYKGEDNNIEKHMFSVMMNSDDPDSFMLMSGERKGLWAEPEPKKLWECEYCKVQVVINNNCPYNGNKLENIDDFLEWHNGERVHYESGCGPYKYSNLYNKDEPTKESEYVIDGKSYCPGCAASCTECGDIVLINGAAYGVEAEYVGYSHPTNPFWGIVCLDCHEEESICKECGEYNCKC